MGYAIVMGPCLCCKRPFAFNPRRVPSHEGEPICRECMGEINREKAEAGMRPFVIPVDAYEPLPEGAL